MAWLYLPDMEDSSSESTPPSEAVVPWVTLSGKATQRPLSWRGWQNRPYIELLFGTTLPPSTAARGVELWISSLRASHANLSAWQEPDEAKATSAGSGTISSESFAKFSPDGSLVKTSLDLFHSDSKPFSGRLPRWGTMFRGELFELTRWEPAIGASGFLSSPDWETPNTNPDFYFRKQSGAKLRNDPMFPALAMYWPKNREEIRKIEAENLASGKTPESASGRNWPTPMASELSGRGTSTRKPGTGGKKLDEESKNWPTITASEGDKNAGRRNPSDRVLNQEAKNWPTPDANCWKGGTGGGTRGTGRDGQLDDASSPPDLRISTCGPECSPSHRRLNPAFVEWLMGLPSGWTIAKTGFGPAATELYHYKQQLRSECSRLAQVGS